MAYEFKPIPFYDMISGLGDTVAGGIQKRRIADAFKDFDGDYQSAANKLLGMGHVKEASAIAGLGQDQLLAASLIGSRQASSEPDDLKILRWWQENQGGGPSSGASPNYLSPPDPTSSASSGVPGFSMAQASGLNDIPSAIANKVLSPGELKRQEELGKAQAEREGNATARQKAGSQLEAGIQHLADISVTYGSKDPANYSDFESAVGPLQGADPGGSGIADMLQRGALAAPKLAGELTSRLNFSKFSPTEIRGAIFQGARALGAQVKNIVRGKGEGVWTDRDQALVDQIVGDLAESRDVAEYRRRLNNSVDALNRNFDMSIPYPTYADQAQSQPMDMSIDPPTQRAPVARAVPTMSVTPDGVMTPTQAGMAQPPQVARTDAPRVQKGSPQERQILQWANEAIRNGADQAAVIQRLREMGIEQ